jgi:hypothetical protein
MGLSDDVDAMLAREIDTQVPVEKVTLRDEAERLRFEIVDHVRVFEDVLEDAKAPAPAPCGTRGSRPGPHDLAP